MCSVKPMPIDHLGRHGRFEEAEQSLKHALELYPQVHSVLCEGNTLQTLGQLHLRQGLLGKSQQSLTRVVELCHQVHDMISEGSGH